MNFHIPIAGDLKHHQAISNWFLGNFPSAQNINSSGENSLKAALEIMEGGNWGAAAATDGWSPNDFTLKDTISFMLYS